MIRKITQSFGFITLIFAFIFSAAAQTAPPRPTPPEKTGDEGEVIKVDSRLVVVPVSVTDAAGQPVSGLKAQDFRISEENKPQEIAQVSDAEKVPLEIALLFDVSASTDAMFKFEQETAAQFLRDVMRPEDRASVFTIGERAVLVEPRDVAEKAAAAIQKIQPTKEFTAFYDTVSAAADYLQKNAPQGRRKVIIVISDGEDTNSFRIARAIQDSYSKLGQKINTLDTKSLYQITVASRDAANESERRRVLQNIQNADTVFYSINPAGSSYQLNKISVFGQSNMQLFADDTGGAAFLPKFQPIDTKDALQNSFNIKQNQDTLTKIFRQLTNELQAQYLVQYYSDANFPNGKFVKLDVNLTNPKNYRVRARQGYFAKN
ncbi:MAG: VWA domain-containing protein [Pyrinomonadaceae bacterium]